MNYQQEIVDLTKKLMTMPTLSEDREENEKALKFVMEYFDVHKNHIRYYKDHTHPSLVVATQPLTKKFDIILHGHMDVVPAFADEFTPKEYDGKIFGRGAADMKGGLATIIVLMKNLIHEHTDKNIGLLITTDEEIGGIHGTKYLLDTIGYRGKFFITAEGITTQTIVTKAKGMLRIIIESHGTEAHGAKVWLGDNAIEKLYKAYEEINKLFPTKDNKDNWYTTINLQRIQGGETFTRVPNYAEAELDIRFTQDWKSCEHIVKEVEKIVKKFDRVHLKRTHVNEEMLLTENDNPFVQKLKKVLTKHVKHLPHPTGVAHGTSDARFASQYGIPGVEFGPVGKNSHNHSEHVEIKSLTTYYDILREFLHE